MKKIISRVVFLFAIGLVQQSAAAVSDGDCERLETGDNFDELNKILDCIESKITGGSFVTATNVEVYSHEKEPNDLIGNANIITLGTTLKGKIKEGNEFDIFKFSAPDTDKGVRVILRQTNTSGFWPRLKIYDSTETHLKTYSDTSTNTVSFVLKTEPEEDYYIYVTCRDYCRENNTYELLVRAE